MLRKITAFEPVTPMLVNQIASERGFIGITPASEIDIAAGAGVIDGMTKCLWTKSGHRVEIWFKDGEFGTMTSPAVDPLRPLLK